MASTNKTSLGLNMWEASDKPVRQDFVNDNAIINEKLTALNKEVDAGFAQLNSDLTELATDITNNDMTSGTLLDWFIANKNTHKDTFVVAPNGYPADGPGQFEGYVQFLRGTGGDRTVVLYWTYETGAVTSGYLWQRTIHNQSWTTGWVQII